MKTQIFSTFIIISVLLILSGCVNEKDKSLSILITKFPIEENIDTVCSVTPMGGEYLTNSINTAGNHIVCVDYDAPFLLSIYDKNLVLTDTIVKRGHGHNEMLSSLYFGQWSGSQDNPDIIVYDLERKLLAKLNIAPFSGINTIASFSNASEINPSKLFLLKDSTFVGINLPAGEQACLFKYDNKDKKVTFASDLVKFKKDNVFYTSQCGLAVSDDEKQFITPFYSLPLICIYDENLNLKKRLFVGNEINTETISVNDTYPGFVDAKFIRDKFVALLMDPSGKDSSKLLIFDKEGKPLASYSIGMALGFCFDENLDSIISLGYDDNTNMMKFYVYKIPQLLKNTSNN